MTPIEQAILAMNAAIAGVCGTTVTYRRGNDSIDGMSATKVRIKTSDLSLDPNVSITGKEQDWIVSASDLAIAGQLTLPKTKDEIDWFDTNGVKHTYRVMKRLGDRCYRPTDGTGLLLRIFTVEQLPSG